MAEQSNQLVQKLWNYCNILRDDGLSYGVYSEQLTFLPFLGRAAPGAVQQAVADSQERRLAESDAAAGDELETHYRHVLESLRKY
jgi:type I restriction enzyme M protein